MNKVVKYGLIGVGGLVGLVGLFCAFVAIRGCPTYERPKANITVASTPEKVERGKRLATAMCVGCHLDGNTKKLTGRVIFDAPPVFGVIVSRNITQDKTHGIGGWTDAEIAGTIRTGIVGDGSFSPIMGGKHALADEDLESIIAWLRSDDPRLAATAIDPPGRTKPSFLVKFLTTVAIKPPKVPTAPIHRPTEEVALGKYLVTGAYGCYGCHSEDFASQNHEVPEKTPGYFGGGNKLISLEGGNIFSANLTPDDATGIGTITKEQFRGALLQGVGFNKKALRSPMGQFRGMTEAEADAIYAYLRTVPKISRAVDRIYKIVPAGDPGKAAYLTLGCMSCHGPDGVGYFSLKDVNKNFKTDEELKAYIQNPAKVRPLASMPSFETVAEPQQLDAVMKYVRSFGAP